MYRISAKYNQAGIERQKDCGAIFLGYSGCRESYEDCYAFITRNKEFLENWEIFRQDEVLVASSEEENEY